VKKFRLPRKEKKSFKGKLLLYPADEKGNSLMAQPRRSQKDYDAWRQGILRDLFDSKRAKERSREMFEKLDPEICIPDEQLKEYVNDIFSEDVRSSAFSALIRAKNSKTAIKAYYNFVNAYHIYKKGEDSYGNICCLALDSAEELLRKENSMGRKRK